MGEPGFPSTLTKFVSKYPIRHRKFSGNLPIPIQKAIGISMGLGELRSISPKLATLFFW